MKIHFASTARSWIRPLFVLNFLVLGGAVWLFLFIAHEVSDGDHQPSELSFMRAFRSMGQAHSSGDWIMGAARDITALGSMIVLTTLTVLTLGFLFLSRRFVAAVFLLTAAFGGQLLNTSLKLVYGRDRPDSSLRWVEVDSLSFPSGHATSSAVIYLVMAVLLSRLVDSPIRKFYIFACALLVSFLVGVSRVFLGVHYPTDVVAGWALGLAWAEVCWFSARVVGLRLQRITPPHVATHQPHE